MAEWLCFFFFNKLMHYSFATMAAFLISTFINWGSGRLILFKEKSTSLMRELLQIYSASIIGMILNLVIMYMAVEVIVISEMMSKIIATGIGFFWNFFIRKLVIYKM